MRSHVDVADAMTKTRRSSGEYPARIPAELVEMPFPEPLYPDWGDLLRARSLLIGPSCD